MNIFENLDSVVSDKLKISLSKIKNQNNGVNAKSQEIIKENSLDSLYFADDELKNHFYFENLSDDDFFNPFGSKESFVNFYKKITKTGVGTIILGGVIIGIKPDITSHFARICLSEQNIEIYKKIVLFAHSNKTKVFLKIKSAFGRFNNNYNPKSLKLGSNYGIDSENNQKIIMRISDNKCSDLVAELARTAVLSEIAGFDGVMIDASLSNVIGELSSSEFNKRIFGYFSETTDFITKTLKYIGIKNNTIILKYSLFSMFIKTKNSVDFCKINQGFNYSKLISNLTKLIKLGVDGFEFVFGQKENEFLTNFNEYEDELLFLDFIKEFRKYLNENNIKNKFGEDVMIYYHDNFKDFSKTNGLLKEKIVNYIDVTKNIYSDDNFLKNLKIGKSFNDCIKCSYCNLISDKKGKVECLINPELCNFDNIINGSNKGLVAVVGSGISGLICSLTLAKRGFTVHIFEKHSSLNSVGKLTTIFGFDEKLKNYFGYIEKQVLDYERRNKIILHLNENFEASNDNLSQYQSIIVATGFRTKFLSVPGAVLSSVQNIYDVLDNEKIFTNKKNIVIYAKSELSLKLAIYLLKSNKKITLIIKNTELFIENKNANLLYYFHNLYNLGADILFFARIIKINEDNADIIFCKNLDKNNPKTLVDLFSKKRIKQDFRQRNIDCDLLVYEPDIAPKNKLYAEIVNKNYRGEVYLIGNALENCNLAEAIKSGYFVGKNL